MTPRNNRNAVLSLALALATGGCIAPSGGGSDVEDGYQTFDEYVASLPVDDRGAHVVEGDIPVYDREELEKYYAMTFPDTALVLDQTTAKVDNKYTASQALKLTYCVSDAFGADKEAVADAMESATREWMDATKIASSDAPTVKFTYLATQDTKCDASNADVFFDVVPVSDVPYDALSFFPNYTRANRSLRVSRGAIVPFHGQTLVGVLRHEVGHVLGFRHEHVNMPSKICVETLKPNWRALTPYDLPSVMHYRQIESEECASSAINDYTLTTYDIAGARCIYTTQARASSDSAGDACKALTSLSTVVSSYAIDAGGQLYRMVRSNSGGKTTATIARYIAPGTTSKQSWTSIWTENVASSTATTEIYAGGNVLYRRTASGVYRWSGKTWIKATGEAGTSVVVAAKSGDLFRLNSNGSVDRWQANLANVTAILTTHVTGRKIFAGNTKLFRLDSNGDLYTWTTAGWSGRIGSGIKSVAETETSFTFALLTGTSGTVMKLGTSGTWTTIGKGASNIWGGLEVPYMSMLDEAKTSANEALTIKRNAKGTTWYKYALNATRIMNGSARRVVVNTNGRIYGYATP